MDTTTEDGPPACHQPKANTIRSNWEQNRPAIWQLLVRAAQLLVPSTALIPCHLATRLPCTTKISDHLCPVADILALGGRYPISGCSHCQNLGFPFESFVLSSLLGRELDQFKFCISDQSILFYLRKLNFMRVPESCYFINSKYFQLNFAKTRLSG